MGRPRRDREGERARAEAALSRCNDAELFEQQVWSDEELEGLTELFVGEPEGALEYVKRRGGKP
jgi:hypothetical protein